MPERMVAILDPAAGVSGDMLLGALISAGAPREWLCGLPRRLGLDGVIVEIEDVLRASLRATKVTVRAPDGRSEEPADVGLENGHAHPSPGHSHHGHHSGHSHGHAPHRHVSELLDIVDRAEISPRTRARARRTLELLAEAEGRVHGMAPDRVALHEVGALDALVDMVGVIEGFEQLNLEDIYTMPVALGNGWVHAAHGLLPVPAPASAYHSGGTSLASALLPFANSTQRSRPAVQESDAPFRTPSEGDGEWASPSDSASVQARPASSVSGEISGARLPRSSSMFS
jgi:uncharacterized protein (DUF111 family)